MPATIASNREAMLLFYVVSIGSPSDNSFP